jgi:hypothetical protein
VGRVPEWSKAPDFDFNGRRHSSSLIVIGSHGLPGNLSAAVVLRLFHSLRLPSSSVAISVAHHAKPSGAIRVPISLKLRTRYEANQWPIDISGEPRVPSSHARHACAAWHVSASTSR